MDFNVFKLSDLWVGLCQNVINAELSPVKLILAEVITELPYKVYFKIKNTSPAQGTAAVWGRWGLVPLVIMTFLDYSCDMLEGAQLLVLKHLQASRMCL